MNFHFFREPGLVLALAVLVTACAGVPTDDVVGGPGMSDLAPSYDARPDPGSAGVEPARKPTNRRAVDPGDKGAEPGASTSVTGRPAQRPAGSARGNATPPGAGRTAQGAATKAARITDPADDLTRSLEGAPASADIVAVTLRRSGSRAAVRTRFAAAVPVRQSGGRGMNVASFYDVDDDGIVDYEVWASLADDGWGTGHLDRREGRASFGPDTRIEVRVEGDTLVTTFPLDRVGGAAVFRWSAASEWGSFESMASSTSARDHAPDNGAAGYPG